MAGTELSKTRQVYLALRDRIERGVFAREGGLPGEQALAAELMVSRVTLRRALAAILSDQKWRVE
jgi:DNA-binding GntR family transcriptional regulator